MDFLSPWSRLSPSSRICPHSAPSARTRPETELRPQTRRQRSAGTQVYQGGPGVQSPRRRDRSRGGRTGRKGRVAGHRTNTHCEKRVRGLPLSLGSGFHASRSEVWSLIRHRSTPGENSMAVGLGGSLCARSRLTRHRGGGRKEQGREFASSEALQGGRTQQVR